MSYAPRMFSTSSNKNRNMGIAGLIGVVVFIALIVIFLILPATIAWPYCMGQEKVDCEGDWGACTDGKKTWTITKDKKCGGKVCEDPVGTTRKEGDIKDCDADVDCVGEWGTCQDGKKTYKITTEQVANGKVCEDPVGTTRKHGDVEACTENNENNENNENEDVWTLLRNEYRKTCIDGGNNIFLNGSCTRRSHLQWSNVNGVLKNKNKQKCLDEELNLTMCDYTDKKQQWSMNNDNSWVNANSSKCISSEGGLNIQDCDSDNNYQKWVDGCTNSEGATIPCIKPTISAAVYNYETNTYLFFKGDEYWSKPRGGDVTGPVNISDFGGLNISNIDAILYKDTANKYYIFKGDKIWTKLKGVDNMVTGPTNISDSGFEGIPSYLDAAVYNPLDNEYYFFKGDKYWTKPSGRDVTGPENISSKFGGLNVTNLDSVIWNHENNKVYFFKGDEYWTGSSGDADVTGPRNINDSWDSLYDKMK